MENKQEALPHYLNSDDFYGLAKEMIEAKKDGEELALVSLDFDNFNFINDLFSYEVGDKVLQKITEHFSASMNGREAFTRLHADHFVFWTWAKETADIIKRFCDMTDMKQALSTILPPHYNLVSSGGIVFLTDGDNSLSALLDKANFARKQAKGNHVNTFLYYDEKMSDELEWRKAITLMMESALTENEFEMYLQPKVLIQTGQIVGAEALARWNSKKYGMIYPDRFIPILEQNGFVKELDFFMLEQACIFIKQSIKEGMPALPISVNFSKIHIRTRDFVDRVFHTVNQYCVPTRLIEIEFTENIYLDDFQTLVEITSALKYLGFKVALDDFGSAYSSLNYLKDLPLDVIKIDKAFLNSSENTDKGRIIIEKVVELIKSLRLAAVMEGVETGEQVDFLQKLSCDFGQGYYFAKPMPTAEYSNFIRNGSTITDIDGYLSGKNQSNEKSYLDIIPQEFQMDNWELYTLGQNIDMGLMKGYLDGGPTVQYINNKALEYFGYSRQEFREIFNNNVAAFTYPDDVGVVQSSAKRLAKTGKPLQFQLRAIRKDGKVIVLQGNASCVMDSQGRPVGIYAFQDVTEELERTEALQRSLKDKITELETLVASEHESREKLRDSEERYRLIVEQSDDVMFEWDFATDSIEFSEKYEKMFGRKAVQKNITTNIKIKEHVFPEDRPSFEKWINSTYKSGGCAQLEFRLQAADGHFVRIRCRTTSINDSNGFPIKAVGVFTKVD
ncbi:MAG: EAL domain-containing protein [Oscillospiraceae bacterium]